MPNETAFASSHRQKKTWLTVLAVLAVLVVFATVAALTMPASAMTAPATPETAAIGETAAPESSALPQDNAAPSDTAQSDTVTEQAEAETAALPTAAQVPEDYTVQRTVRDQENGFAVTVYAPEGVIPEGAALSATLLTEGDEAYRQAEQALAEETDGSGYGFAALDIHLEDADGNEVEPNGDVFVSIDAAGLIPEDVDPESVTVQHHEEQPADADGTAVTVETVADAADETEGVVEVTPAEEAENNSTSTLQAPEDAPATEVQAAFTVDGFSTFTITYTVNGINYSRPVSVLLDGVEMTTEQLTTLLGSSPEIRLTDENWTDVKNLIPNSIRDSITLTVDGTQTRYSFGYAANSVGIKLHYVRIFGSKGDWLRTNRSDRPNDDQNSVDTSPDDADWRILEFPEGETLRLYYFSKYSGETPDEIETADTSNLISINLFDYTGSNINDVINGIGNYYDYDDYDETNGETFRFTGSSEDYSAGGDNGNEPYYTHWTQRDGGVVQGIVQDELGENGYPQLNRDYVTSMEDLFNPGNTNNKAYTNLNHLFTYDADTNFYSFDSSLNFATINPEGHLGNSGNELNFTVYARPNDGTSDGSTGIPYFIPFNEYGTNQHISGNGKFANYHFGMTIATEFLMPRDGEIDGEDMIFSFSGDDDVWVYIDGVLILDMGGIHDSCSGTINFAEGTATVDKVYATNGTRQSNGSRTIYIGDALAAAYNTTWANENLEQRRVGGEEHWFLPDYTQHDLSFFYLERGAVDSNCKIEFNLYTLQSNSLTVGKEIEAGSSTTPEIENWLGNLEYTFRVLNQNAKPDTTESDDLFIKPSKMFTIYEGDRPTERTGTVGEDGTFTLHAGERAFFADIAENSGGYYVQELVESEYSAQFGTVQVNVNPGGGETFAENEAPAGFDGVSSNKLDASAAGYVLFTNTVETENLSLLTITKAAAEGSVFPAGETFRVYAEIDGEPVDGTFGTGNTPVTFADGFADFQVGTTVSIPVLTGANFTIYEVGGEGYEVTYTAAQTFPEDKGGAYTLTEVKTEDGVETVQGEVGDLEHTTNVEGVTDATGATMAVTLTNKKTSADLTIVKNIYGLNAEQVVHLVNGDYSKETCDNNDGHIGNHKHGLRFDVDYFNAKESAIKDDYKDKGSFIDDWTFDVQQTLTKKNAESEDDSFISENAAWSGDINEEGVDMDTQGQEDDQAEVKHYQNSSLTYVVPAEGEPYYQYTITIQDVKLTNWYHVMETRTTVDGYDLAASVATTVTGTGTEISNLIEGNNGTKTAFQLTGDTTVTFTNRYTHNTVTVNMKKVESGSSNGLAGAKFYLYYTETQGDTSTRYYYQAPAAGEEEAKWLEQTNDDEVPAGATQIVSGPDGALQVPGLAVDREYTLQEVEAPAGYQLPTNTILIRVGADGLVTVKYDNGEGVAFTVAEGADKPDSSTKPWDPADITYLIPNTTGAELPATGGAGTTFLTIGGLLMMAAAVGGGCVLRRRRGREGN